MKNLFYYRLEQAEEIKSTYSSWVGKHAHVGQGIIGTLKSITIKPTRTYKSSRLSKLYRIEFEFDNNKKFSAHEFLFYNGLIRESINESL